MDTLLALAPLAAPLAAIGAIALLVDRFLGDHDLGAEILFTIQPDPPRSREIEEEEPVRWNVARLRRPSGRAPGTSAAPSHGGFEVACSP